MRFKGKLGVHIIDHETGALIGVFDKKGFINITDDRCITRMKKRFKSVEEKMPDKKTVPRKTAAKRSVSKA